MMFVLRQMFGYKEPSGLFRRSHVVIINKPVLNLVSLGDRYYRVVRELFDEEHFKYVPFSRTVFNAWKEIQS